MEPLFRHDAIATRADLAAFLYRAAGLPAAVEAGAAAYEDIGPAVREHREIAWLASRGYAPVGSDGVFVTDAVVTFGDVAHAVHHLAGVEPVIRVPGLSFAPFAPSWPYAGAVAWLADLDLASAPAAEADVRASDPWDALITRGALAQLLFELDRTGVTLSSEPSILDSLERVAAAAPVSEGLSNGRLPASALCPIAWVPGEALACDAAADLARLNAAFRAHTGLDIPISDSYRDLAGQWTALARHGHLAAVPGTSQHGWGKAIDLNGRALPGGYAGEAYWWLIAHAPAYGWELPAWARPLGGKPEPWHLEHLG